MTKAQEKELLIQSTIEKLKEIFKEDGFNVYCKNHHTSRSGMMRVIEFWSEKGNDLTEYFHILTGYNYHNKYNGLRVTGVGMDMGFHVVYTVSGKLYDKFTDSYGRERDGGYVLKNLWV